MRAMTDGEVAFVPVNRSSLEALRAVMARVGRAAVAQRASVARLLELADDLRVDALRRLRESGATEAQVERYEAAYREQADAVSRSGAALDATLGELGRVTQELADV